MPQYEPPDWLWPPQRNGLLKTIEAIENGEDVCLYGPCGSGKTIVARELFNWCMSTGKRGIFYVNRRALIPQTADKFQEDMIPLGIRAAEYDDQYDWTAPFQVASADTDASRVYRRKIWALSKADLVVIDEAHLQRTQTMRQLIADYHQMGARIVGMTATPIGLSDWFDRLVVSGTMQDYFRCSAVVPARVFSPIMPDMRNVKRNKVGEFVVNGERKRLYCQQIVGQVWEHWKKHNPDGRPTLMYGPDVAGSVWLTEYFRQKGVNFAHVDANDAVVDGQRTTCSRYTWQEIQERFREGNIAGISSRFRTREGLDFPEVFCELLCTPIGSLASYIQVAGRALRYSDATPEHVILLDFGGSYWRHGSPNETRDWQAFWSMNERVVSEYKQRGIKERGEPEPIRCPRCGMERLKGPKCPDPPHGCGYQHPKSKRMVLMTDGKLVERNGKLLRKQATKQESDTQRLWTGMFWGWYKSKRCEKKTFNQLRAWFFHKHHYWPPKTLDLMPVLDTDWAKKIQSLPLSRLRGHIQRSEDNRDGQNKGKTQDRNDPVGSNRNKVYQNTLWD